MWKFSEKCSSYEVLLPNILPFLINGELINKTFYCWLINGQILLIGHTRTFDPTFKRTTRTCASLPGRTSITRPSGYFPRGVSGDGTMTMSPSLRLRCSRRHFARRLRVGIHSVIKRFQKCCRTSWTLLHLCFSVGRPLIVGTNDSPPTGHSRNGWV